MQVQVKGGGKSQTDSAVNMIKYDQFWKTLKAKGISTHSLDMLCTTLDCRIEDIIEFVKDQKFISENQKDE